MCLGPPFLLWIGLLLADGRPLPGTRVDGVALPREPQRLRPFLQRQARRWARETLVLEVGVHRFYPTRETLGAQKSVHAILEEIHGLGHDINPVLALSACWNAFVQDGHDLQWLASIADETALERYVESLRALIDRKPVPGIEDIHGQAVPGIPGETLDVNLTKRALRQAIVTSRKKVRVRTHIAPPPLAPQRWHPKPGTADQSVLMMRQETLYRAGDNGRAHNIELSAAKLSGRLIPPNGLLSFNQVVGKRTIYAGFQPATEVVNGEIVDGIGGGVCQTAGTLHAAAFFAGMVIEEHQPHSRLNRFRYLHPGLDAMVAWPDSVTDVKHTRDLKIRNPYPFPVVVSTKTLPAPAKPGKALVRVDLRGAARAFRVDWSFREMRRTPVYEIHRVDPALPVGTQRVQQAGLYGLVISRRRTIYFPGGRQEETKEIAYPPTPRIIRVAPFARAPRGQVPSRVN